MIQKISLIICLLLPTLSYAKNIIYSSGSKKYEGYYKDKGKKAPLVFILHDWDGITEYEIKRAEMLEAQGYSVFIADLFGQGIRPTENKDKMQHTGELYKDRKKMNALMQAGLKQAKKLGLNIKNMVVMGYCFGGAAVLELARSGQVAKGFATFHGGLQTPEGQNYKKTKSKFVIYHGTADEHISMKDFSDLALAFNAYKIDHEMITYGNAVHAFTVFDAPSYQKEADEKSWAHFLGFLKANF
jgi:dienelactone hydrolase